MHKKSFHPLSLFLLCFALLIGTATASAQEAPTCSDDDPTSCVVTGTDPQPIGHRAGGGSDGTEPSDPDAIYNQAIANPFDSDVFLYALLELLGLA